jgi:hypothetical protein
MRRYQVMSGSLLDQKEAVQFFEIVVNIADWLNENKLSLPHQPYQMSKPMVSRWSAKDSASSAPSSSPSESKSQGPTASDTSEHFDEFRYINLWFLS